MFWTKNKEKKRAGTTIIGLHFEGQAAIGTDFDPENPDGDEVGIIKACSGMLMGFTGNCECAPIAEKFETMINNCENIDDTCREISTIWQQDPSFNELEGKLIAISKEGSYAIAPGNAERIKTGIVAVGPGEEYALAAIRAVLSQPEVSETVSEIVKKAFTVAAGVCVLVNSSARIITLE